MERLATAARPLRIAIIGAGPAGLYAAEALLKQRALVLTVDIFNRFPTPFGLVRDGVAPDHQSIKAVVRVFDKVLADPRVRFFGNVTYGVDIHPEELKHFYDQIIYAVGAQADRRMGIPGEESPNSLPATAFVGWYNGHPGYHDLPIDLSCERAVVVGNGNVAMDVTRLLVMSPDVLMKTDIAAHALKKLRESKIREVVILGRRGAVQASFTNAEIKELGKLEAVDVIVDPQDIELDPNSRATVGENRVAAVNLEYLRAYAAPTELSAPRRITMRFLASPVEIVSVSGQITAVKIERNELVVAPKGELVAKGTGKFERIEAGLVLRSIGYRSVPIEGVPFDHTTATMSNSAGRIVLPDTGKTVPGEYVVGWAKRGPTGLIGNNKPDAAATVEAMLTDLPALQGISDECRDLVQIKAFLHGRNIDYVTYQDWKQLDRYEVARGAEQGCPRIKVTTTSEMMAIIHQARKDSTVGVMVMALGTPAGPDDIEAYYTHMREGHPPSPELLSELQRRYAAIGGRSPLLEHTQAQARGLQAALDQADPGRFRVTLGMQHSRPFIEDSLAELVESGVQQVVGLVLAPHYSRLSVGVYSERLKAANTPSLPLSMIEHWHLAPGYLNFLETSLQATLERMIRKHGMDADNIEVLFTAHSLPVRILAMNDPYPEQVRETAEAVASRLSLQRWAIAWQSAGRTTEPWIGPALLDVLAELPGRGSEGVVVCSAGFVSDHLEILYDLDIEVRQAAQRLGLAFERTPMPNDDPGFLSAL
ncbi:MAG TPA: ferrochelatase, partial [Ktedonobacteraceae bacterium]